MDEKEDLVPYVVDVEIEDLPTGNLVFARQAGECLWPAIQIRRGAGPRHWNVFWLAKPNVWGKVSKEWTVPYESHRNELVDMELDGRKSWGDWNAAIVMADALLERHKASEVEKKRRLIDLNRPCHFPDEERTVSNLESFFESPANVENMLALEFDVPTKISGNSAGKRNVEPMEAIKVAKNMAPGARESCLPSKGVQEALIDQESGSNPKTSDVCFAESTGGHIPDSPIDNTSKEMWGCCAKCQRWMVLQSGVNQCACGESITRPESTAGNSDHWIRCDKCLKWRIVSHVVLEQYEAKGSLRRWTCEDRYEGGSCLQECDWASMRKEVNKSRKEQALLTKGVEEADIQEFKLSWCRAQGSMNMHANPSVSNPRQSSYVQDANPSATAQPADADLWLECKSCKQWIQVGDGKQYASCHCGRVLCRPKISKDPERWIECELCSKWRKISSRYYNILAGLADQVPWTCNKLFRGATCASLYGDWDSIQVARQSSKNKQHVEDRLLVKMDLVESLESGKQKNEYWPIDSCNAGTMFSFIPHVDEEYSPERLVQGLNAYDKDTGQYILASRAIDASFFSVIQPFMQSALDMFQDGKLPLVTDGRAAAGPVNLVAFLERPEIKERVERALHRRRERLGHLNDMHHRDQDLIHVVHVKPSGRSVYIGDEHDRTVNGTKIMEYNKMWQGNPIQSWSGGQKLQDMPGHQKPRIVTSKLSKLLAGTEIHLRNAAEVLWDAMMRDPHLGRSAHRMLEYYSECSEEASCRLGGTGWNAYSLNVDFVTAIHLDRKNVPGSFSALVVFEVGLPYRGGHYCLPQYHKALDCRQGIVLYHRSGEPGIGLHANCALHRPTAGSHRVSLILYQTAMRKAPRGGTPFRPSTSLDTKGTA